MMRTEFAARVMRDVPMSKHTSWHAGGPADLFFTPRDADDLAQFIKQLPPQTPVLWIGLGSNLLVRDGGVRGAVVSTLGTLGTLEREGPARVYAEAGVPCARIARQCVKWGMGPAEFFAGIPGTLGGALAMNAGARPGGTSSRSRSSTDAAHVIRARRPNTTSPTGTSPGRPTSGSSPRAWNSSCSPAPART
jgi:UDP-N-acetylmuramate dehydrogenase